jgi:hypothetical protein
MGAYLTGRSEPLWIITEQDRNVGTTVLLPEEY